MPTVSTALTIPNVAIPQVWDVVVDFEHYPQSMPDVLEVTIDDQSAGECVTTWSVLLNGSELTWTERDTFFPYELIKFDQIDGDLEIFRGEWRLTETSLGIRVDLELEFDLGIPSLANVLNPIGIQAVRRNAQSMLDGIGASL